MPKAKLIKYTPSEVSRYFDRYEYECIECGEHYFRCTSNARINPYCANCCRKHDRIKARERNKKRDESIYQNAIDDAKEYIHNAIAHDGRDGWTAKSWEDYIMVCLDNVKYK